MRHAKHAITCLIGLALCIGPAPARADDEPQIVVEADATEIFLGESIDYLVELRNVKDPSSPDVSALRADFDVAANGDESRNQSSTVIFNGRVTRQVSFGHVYRFRLTPRRAGKLVIPAISASIEGKVITGRPLDLNVVAPEAQDLVIPEVKIDRARVYPTQPFEVTLRLLVRPLPDNADVDPLRPLRRRPPHLEVNWVELSKGLSGDDRVRWLEKLLADNGSGFTLNDITTRSAGFFEGPSLAVFDLHRGRETRKGLDGRPVNYFVYELKRTLTADKAETYEFGPAVVKGSFVSGLEGGGYTGQRLVAVAPKVSLEVRSVPVPRPATFCGGIGNYRVAASATPTELRVGDPLTLALNFERAPGGGSLDLISAPDLAGNPEIAADFEVLDKSPTGRREGEAKRFEYALRPKREGVGVPRLAVTVFDPDTEKFSEVTTDPIALTVSAGSRLAAGDLVGSLPGSGSPEIKSSAQGIFQNVTDPSELFDQRVSLFALAGMTAGLWCVVGCVFVVVRTHRRQSGNVAWQRKRHARRSAERKLAEARGLVAAGRDTDAHRAVRSALLGLIADMRNIVAEGLTASEADATLAQTAVPAAERAEVLRLLEAIESAEYGSGTRSEASSVIESAAKLLPSLTRHTERGS